MTLRLETRTGWPPELCVLLNKYPREVWDGHRNLGEMARFWLERHQGFRELGRMLEKATTEFREQRSAAAEFRAFFAPRLQFFLQNLEGHHQIEDLHYFPVFRAAESRLVKGFDVLERDHEAIHAQILQVVDAANSLLGKLDSDDSIRRAATEDYAAAGEGLLKSLSRHLGDEEDLIVPVILDQSERELFRT